jgi:putative transposase
MVPRRVRHAVLANGVDCGLHKTERLMRQGALRVRPRRRGLPLDRGERAAGVVLANILDRQFHAGAPNQKWAADFTRVWTAEGWLYVAVVIDWSKRASMAAQLVTHALVMAIWWRGRPRALLHHSDRGCQYSSEEFQRLMAYHGVTCSTSRSGNVWDNAAMESFFSSLKTERLARKIYRTRDAARAAVFDYIERFYNPTRRHSAILALWSSSAWPPQAKLGVHRTGSRPLGKRHTSSRMRPAYLAGPASERGLS